MRINLDLPDATYRLLADLAYVERRALRDEATYLLERALRREAARLTRSRRRADENPTTANLLPASPYRDE